MRTSLVALFGAALASLTNAYTTPVGASPEGNAITKPGLAEIVPVGAPYKITWDPSTQGTVTLVLLRGPSNNVLPLYPIAQEIPNSGSYEWTPSSDLQPDTTHYGIQLIVDSNGQYQYTSQFGISNPNYSASSSSSSASSSSSSSSAVVTPALGGPVSAANQEQVANSSAPSKASSVSSSISSIASTATASAQSNQSAPSSSAGSAASSSYVAATSSGASVTSSGYAAATSSYAQVTSSYSAPSTLSTSAVSTSKPANATSSPLASTGGAGKTALHFGGVVAGSIGAAMVLLL
ncbi:MAG: hypothetical protein M1819_000568 [Sarea resinae]|nr:MAG: hypothetical protein M1819_000568 [Sarea resinae]